MAELSARSSGLQCPNPGAERAPSSWLQRTRQCVQRSPGLRLAIPDPQPVSVLAVQRYLGESGRCRYYYDITVYDGSVQETWLLCPQLNPLVQAKRLRAGSRATISLCSYRYAEKKLIGGLVCIEQLQDGKDMEEDFPPVGPLLPLCGGRKHYLPLWNNDDPYGEMWRDEQQHAPSASLDVSKICSLQRLEAKYYAQKSLQPLLVRIMHKSRLRFFGKADKKVDYAYQAYFEVADHTGMMSMVMWNYLCPEWYKVLQVGNVVFLNQYALKQSYPNRTRPTPGNKEVNRLPDLEISLNVRDPTSQISLIREEDVKPEWRLPDVKYQFVTLSEMNNLTHNQVCDVIGLVTYVGRSERKRISDDGEDFWLYRWVHVIDGTSDQPLPLEIYATSQPQDFEAIRPTAFLVCTQMRMIREHPEDEFHPAYLTTSNESQLFGPIYRPGQPCVRDEKVDDFIRWMAAQYEEDTMNNTTIGGYHPYPPAPATFAKYCSENKVESMLFTIDELKACIAQLHYREHRRVAIQGIIAACRFVGNEESEASEVQSHKEPVSVARRGNTELGSKEPSTSGWKSKRWRGGSTSQSTDKQVVSHSEITNVNMVTRRQKRAVEEELSVIRKVRHRIGQSSHDVDTNMQKLTTGHEEARSSVVAREERDKTRPHGRSWENALWSEVKHQLKDHLHYSTVFPESLLRKFDSRHKEFLMQQVNLHPAKLEKSVSTSTLKIPDFDGASGPGHYEVTILGINHDQAINVSLHLSKSFRLFRPIYLPNNMHCHNVDWDDSTLTRHWLSLREELVKYSSSLDGLRTICVLDVCHLGAGRVEITLNRVYNPNGEEQL